MTPSLDDCLASIYEPGFIPADPGIPPTVPTFPFGAVGNAFGRGSMEGAGNVVGMAVEGVGNAFGAGAANALSISTIAAVGSAAGVGAVDGLSGGWLPTDIASLEIWFKGNDLSGSDQDLIPTWTDASGNGRNATQATSANQPFLEVAELNGLNVVHFNPAATERYMELANLGSTGWTEGTIQCVLQAASDPGSGTRGGPHYFGTAVNTSHYPFSDSNIYNGDMSSVRKTVGNPASTLATWRIYGTRSAANDWKLYLDGVQFFTTATNTVAFGAARLGAGGAAGGFKFDGYIAEWMLFSTALAQSDREKVEGYLAHKWGLTSLLAGGHPYKTTPP